MASEQRGHLETIRRNILKQNSWLREKGIPYLILIGPTPRPGVDPEEGAPNGAVDLKIRKCPFSHSGRSALPTLKRDFLSDSLRESPQKLDEVERGERQEVERKPESRDLKPLDPGFRRGDREED